MRNSSNTQSITQQARHGTLLPLHEMPCLSPGTWDDFKAAICDIFPQHEVAHTSAPLPASLLPLPSAPQLSMLSAVPISPSSPQPPTPAASLYPAALEVLLSPAVPKTPAIPAVPLSPAPDAHFLEAIAAALRSSVQACPPHMPTAAPHPLPASSDCPLLAQPPQPVFAAPSPLPDEVQPPLLRPPPAPDDPPPTPDDKAFCWTRGGLVVMPVAASARNAPPMPSPTVFQLLPQPPPLPDEPQPQPYDSFFRPS